MSPSAPADANPLLRDLVRAVAERHRDTQGPLLPMLHDISAALGYIDPACVPLVADALNLSRAEVYGVVTFYRDFRSEPAGAVTVRLCRAEACQAVGADDLVTHARSTYGAELNETAVDGQVTLEDVFCLGNCALGPSAQVDGRLYGRLTAPRLDEIVRTAAPGAGA